MEKGKVLCLDYGLKHVGVASGDLEDKIAFPRDVLFNKGISELVSDICGICEELNVVLVVVGLPLNMDKEQLGNEMLIEVRNFAKELTKKLKGVKVQLFDERLSSFEAEKLMQESMDKIKLGLGSHAYAAQIILQRFFDNLTV